ncbi:antitoxin (plasmid) [Sphingobium xenophagum]|uniref:Antitoxin n=1 Tax=Sphingobium xenophagum TaxID=121428 RepID=A0A249N0M2_SPHXE|nr:MULTISPECIES: antitoxin Xre-like helix-turn-helix domain-containing protein [Sphingobium]ASY47171.1 antitoxin [Sphingobium xenophagum]MBG6121009.1 putative toxin-antitoxin system antitoxin component (TIGR02293 family) [Sphingobium sp. JAI105]
MATQPHSIEALLGVRAGIHTSRLSLPTSIESGLPVAALDRLADKVAPGDARFKFRLIPKATLERRRKSASKRLTSEEGDRLARLAKVFSFALDIYREPERAREFLGRAHPMLDGKAPLDVALATSPGADLVINLLGRAAYGGGV